MAKDQRNVLRLRRGRTVGLGLIVIMGFLLFGFVFLVDEPTQIVIVPDDPFTPEDEEIVIELPPIDDFLDFEVPIPQFDPIEISLTPIITTTDSLGVEDVVRGETTFLQAFGLDLIQVGVPDKTFDNGNIKIELEFDTGNIFPMEIFFVKPSLDVVTIESGGTFTNTFAVPPKTSQGTDVITVIGIQAQTPDCTLELPCIIGTSTGGIFTINIFESPIGDIPLGESITTNFILTQLDVNISEDKVVGIEDPALLPTPLPSLPLAITEAIIPIDTDTRIEPVNFILTQPTQLYSVTFANEDLVIELVEQIVNATEIVVEEVVTEDIPFVPCPLPVKTDSISILFPSIGVSGTSALWDKILIDDKLHDIINVDIRNNRNCDLTLAVGSQWQRVTGEIFKSDIETFIVSTNSTQPFSSIPFDGSVDCGTPAGNCAGLEIQWCFIAKATVDDVTEIVDPFCGKKFYR
jgi:hypothetical protein